MPPDQTTRNPEAEPMTDPRPQFTRPAQQAPRSAPRDAHANGHGDGHTVTLSGLSAYYGDQPGGQGRHPGRTPPTR